jgi:hypothetical protein
VRTIHKLLHHEEFHKLTLYQQNICIKYFKWKDVCTNKTMLYQKKRINEDQGHHHILTIKASSRNLSCKLSYEVGSSSGRTVYLSDTQTVCFMGTEFSA